MHVHNTLSNKLPYSLCVFNSRFDNSTNRNTYNYVDLG
jgi:hypothetical protein